MKTIINAIRKTTSAIPWLAVSFLAIACSSDAQKNGEATLPAKAVQDGDLANADERPADMFIMMLKLTDQGIEKIKVTRAQNSLNRRDGDSRQPTFYRVLDADGKTIGERGFTMPTELRAEAPDENGNLSGTSIPVKEPMFVIKVPAHENLAVIQLFRINPDQTRENAELLGEVRP